MDFTKIKSVKDYIREQEDEAAQKTQDEMDQKIEALFLSGEPVTEDSLQVFADENAISLEDLKTKIFGLMTTLLTNKNSEDDGAEAKSPVEGPVVDEAVVGSETDEKDMKSGDEEELKEDEESPDEPSNDEHTDDEEEEPEFNIGDKVSFETENEAHPLSSMDMEIIDVDNGFVQCLVKNPETGVQDTQWFRNNEVKKIPDEVKTNPDGEDVSDVEKVESPADEYSSVQKESISDIIRKNLQLFRG